MEELLEKTKAQAFILLPKSELEAMKASLNEVKDLIKGKAKIETEEEWLDSNSAKLLLGVSSKTWQNMRNRRQIEFTQIGRKIYVRRSAITNYLQQHSISK